MTDIPGWFNHGPRVLALIETERPKVCVELGSWLGASAVAVARSIRRWGGVLYCVDTWTGEVNQPAGTPIGAPIMLSSCARHLVEAGVSPNVRLIPATTVAAADAWAGPAIDLLYVDADHAYASVLADLHAWVPHVRSGGVILGDDYASPIYPGVQQAWDDFSREADLPLTRFQSDPPDPTGIQLVYAHV